MTAVPRRVSTVPHMAGQPGTRAFRKPGRAPVRNSILRRSSALLPCELSVALSLPQHLVSSMPHTPALHGWGGRHQRLACCQESSSAERGTPSIPRREDRWHLSCSVLLSVSEEPSARSSRAALIWKGWTRHYVFIKWVEDTALFFSDS